MATIITIIITILYILLGVSFCLLAIFGLPWDGYIQDKIDKIFNRIKDITISLAALLFIAIILLITL